jgi:hypothetical protein
MLPGLKPEHRVLTLAGTNTYGVQAAADFATRVDLAGALLARLNVRPGAHLSDFEVLIEVGISGGVPVRSSLVLMRTH